MRLKINKKILRTFIPLSFIIITSGCDNSEEDFIETPTVGEDTTQQDINDTPSQPIQWCGTPDPEGATVLTNEDSLDYLALVNRCYRLSADFSPHDLRVVDVPSVRGPHNGAHLLRESAATAAEELFEQALIDGYALVAASAYRSYDLQSFYHGHAIEAWGLEEARRRSAIPGHSEHQLGLALDLTTEGLNFDLLQSFSETAEGQWIAKNAHRFGFIISFPDGMEAETGIIYEPWHIRFVGIEAATAMFNDRVILEEFIWQNNN